MNWMCGVTTVPERLDTLLPTTMCALRSGGFEVNRIFVDGTRHQDAAQLSLRWDCDVTARNPRMRALGNWLLGLQELYIRNPQAHRFAMFQDDIIMCRNVRQYMEKCSLDKGYFNLYTAPSSEKHAKGLGWYKSLVVRHRLPTLYACRGALGLVFDRQAVIVLLSQCGFIDKMQGKETGHCGIDGKVGNVLNTAGYAEYVHNPSLIQHTGKESSLDKRRNQTAWDPNHPVHVWEECSNTFPGTGQDAREYAR